MGFYRNLFVKVDYNIN